MKNVFAWLRRQFSHLQISLLVGMLVLMGFGSAIRPAMAQNPSNEEPGHARGIPSRAERVAEETVSLSAEQIIEVLRREPGLLLAVKKALVREAYAEGRVLDTADLEDEPLYRWLREDGRVRVLATREIEVRRYVRPKPTPEEETQGESERQSGGLGLAVLPSGQGAADTRGDILGRQEEIYWRKHDYSQSNGGMAAPALEPESQPRQNSTESRPVNPARSLTQAELGDQLPANGFISNLRLSDPQVSGQRPAGEDDIDANSLERIVSPYSAMVPVSNLLNSTAAVDQARSSMVNPNVSSFADTNTLAASIPGGKNAEFEFSAGRQPGNGRNQMVFPGMHGSRSDSPMEPERAAIRHRANPYANVPSLYDLYTQVAGRAPVLERFGMDVFRNPNNNLDSLPMDLPVGPDYVVGPGDGLNIQLSGSVAQRLVRVVDPEGRVALPEVGAIEVSGRNLGEVQHLVQASLRTEFHDVRADVALGRIRTIRVYVVGDVESPGAYDISSLSSVLNALYAAAGPTARGSLRHLRQYRGKTLVQEIDAYDLLLHGIHSELARLQSGDTLLVPPLGPEVTVQGMVQRPAIYELADEKNLAEILELAGGVLSSGSLRHVDVERTVAHQSRTMLRLDLPEGNGNDNNSDQQAVNTALEHFPIQDGDKIKISPILPYANRTVYLDGHVFHPGKYPYKDGMTVAEILHSYSDLMPEPATHAEIIRLQAPDYTPMVLAFSLDEAMTGNGNALTLKPFDTIRIFGRYDFEDSPVITVSGEVRFPGEHLTNGLTRLRDAIYLAGGAGPDAELEDAQVFRKTEDGKLKVMNVNLAKALAGNPSDNVLLQSSDRLFVHRSPLRADPPTVLIQGEVARPGRYPMGERMTASELVRLAGGLKRGADAQTADLSRYLRSNSREKTFGPSDMEGDKKDGDKGNQNTLDANDVERILGEHHAVEIARALAGDATADARLSDGDVLTIRQAEGWEDLGAVITVKGEVVHPGSYGIQAGERLSSVLMRAGGFGADAFPYGALLERVQVRQFEEKNRADLVRLVSAEGPGLKLIPEGDEDQKLAKQASLMQWQSTLDKLQNTPPAGRLVIHISGDLAHWANTSADICVRRGDVFIVPKSPNFVMVDGSVYNPTAVAFRAGRSAGWYLRQAGGTTNVAVKKAIFVVRADGSVVTGSGSAWSGGVLASELRPGDMLVVPERAYSGTTRWKTTLQTAQLASAVGIAIQVAKGF